MRKNQDRSADPFMEEERSMEQWLDDMDEVPEVVYNNVQNSMLKHLNS